MTNQPQFPTAQKVFHDLAEEVMYLYDRWQDEKDYEDIADYGKAIKSKLEKDFPTVRFLSISKRPFGFTFTADNRRWRIKCNSRTCSIESIK